MTATPSILGQHDDLTLRVLDIPDAPPLFALIDANRPHLAPWFSFVDTVKAESDALAFIQRVQSNLTNSGRFWAGIWRNTRLVGSIGLTGLDHQNRSAEFGIWLDAHHTGHGTATLAAKLLLHFLFTHHNLNRITAQCAADNLSSAALLRRLGFSQEGLLRQAEYANSTFRDVLPFSILRSEWKPHSTGS